jgi:hypothetical protein
MSRCSVFDDEQEVEHSPTPPTPPKHGPRGGRRSSSGSMSKEMRSFIASMEGLGIL